MYCKGVWGWYLIPLGETRSCDSPLFLQAPVDWFGGGTNHWVVIVTFKAHLWLPFSFTICLSHTHLLSMGLNVAKCNLGEAKQETMLAGCLHYSLYIWWSWVLAILQHFPWSQSFAYCSFHKYYSSFSCFCSQPFLPFRCFLVSICTFLHWSSQCDSASEVLLINVGLLWLPFRFACRSLQFFSFTRHLPHTYLLSMGLICRYNIIVVIVIAI